MSLEAGQSFVKGGLGAQDSGMKLPGSAPLSILLMLQLGYLLANDSSILSTLYPATHQAVELACRTFYEHVCIAGTKLQPACWRSNRANHRSDVVWQPWAGDLREVICNGGVLPRTLSD